MRRIIFLFLFVVKNGIYVAHLINNRVVFYDISKSEYYLITDAKELIFKTIILWSNDPLNLARIENNLSQIESYNNLAYRNLFLSLALARHSSPNLEKFTISGTSNLNLQGFTDIFKISERKDKRIKIEAKVNTNWDTVLYNIQEIST